MDQANPGHPIPGQLKSLRRILHMCALPLGAPRSDCGLLLTVGTARIVHSQEIVFGRQAIRRMVSALLGIASSALKGDRDSDFFREASYFRLGELLGGEDDSYPRVSHER